MSPCNTTESLSFLLVPDVGEKNSITRSSLLGLSCVEGCFGVLENLGIRKWRAKPVGVDLPGVTFEAGSWEFRDCKKATS